MIYFSDTGKATVYESDCESDSEELLKEMEKVISFLLYIINIIYRWGKLFFFVRFLFPKDILISKYINLLNCPYIWFNFVIHRKKWGFEKCLSLVSLSILADLNFSVTIEMSTCTNFFSGRNKILLNPKWFNFNISQFK